MTSYELIENENGSVIKKINNDDSISWIPINESNSDYQRYLRWLENPDAKEGGTL